MTEDILTSDRILETAEDVLRRFGPAKATVVDVARALHVSHGSVYRHFSSKAALLDAVTERWLARLSAPLSSALEDAPAPQRLRHWLELLFKAKSESARSDPELFAMYVELAEGAREVVKAHLAELTAQIARIITDGVARGEFTVENPAATARAVLYATARFHNPAHAREWFEPGVDEAFEDVWTLILLGLVANRNATAP
jgi:AcrR family transcriptional regulator